MINSDNDERTPRGYLVLRPEELWLLELLGLFFVGDIEKPRLIRSSETQEPSSRRRRLIFFSFVALKLLRVFSCLISHFGSVFEFSLNFLSREFVIPKSTSENYLSLLGHLDKRICVNEMKNCEDEEKYYAVLSIMSSKFAYENSACVKKVVENHWNMKCLGLNDYWNDHLEKKTTQAFIMSNDTTRTTSNGQETTVVVAFRGTEPFNSEDWCSDFDITWYELPNIGRIHGGFMKALGLQKDCSWPKKPLPNPNRLSPLAYYSIRDSLKTLIIENVDTRIVLTGHSLGGSLAILFAAVLVIHDETDLLERIRGIYTYGQPRVGDSKFGEFMEKKLLQYEVKYVRFVYNYDIVPRLPYDDKDLMFKHFGTCIYYDRHYQPKVLRELSDESYFSLLGNLRMMVNALMELIRSFTIVSEKELEFEEGWLLRFSRVFALTGFTIPILPFGLSNHLPPDYVNAIILTPPRVFQIPKDVSLK